MPPTEVQPSPPLPMTQPTFKIGYPQVWKVQTLSLLFAMDMYAMESTKTVNVFREASYGKVPTILIVIVPVDNVT